MQVQVPAPPKHAWLLGPAGLQAGAPDHAAERLAPFLERAAELGIHRLRFEDSDWNWSARRSAAGSWRLARAAIESGEYDMVVLDEFTYPLTYGWVAWAEVEEVLRGRDPDMHVVITGRGALLELVALADTVTEMEPVKHAYQAGIGGQKGVEY